MNTYTNKFSTNDLDKLKSFFIADGCKFTEQQYAFFKAIGSGYCASFYNSGKLVVQGKCVDNIISKLSTEFKLNIENSNSPMVAYEEISEENYIGVDESGKGDFFGPLVVAGVAVNSNLKKIFLELGIKDSKKLTDEVILKLALEIQKIAKWTTVVITPKKYNELYNKFKNLNKLLAWGHARVIENLLVKAPECTLALSDKFASDDKVIENALMNKGRNIKMVQKTKGENDIAVAAASVIARAEFVSRMKTMSNMYKIIFPKGASDKVINCAKSYVQMYGKEKLDEVAKMHFKTVQNI